MGPALGELDAAPSRCGVTSRDRRDESPSAGRTPLARPCRSARAAPATCERADDRSRRARPMAAVRGNGVDRRGSGIRLERDGGQAAAAHHRPRRLRRRQGSDGLATVGSGCRSCDDAARTWTAPPNGDSSARRWCGCRARETGCSGAPVRSATAPMPRSTTGLSSRCTSRSRSTKPACSVELSGPRWGKPPHAHLGYHDFVVKAVDEISSAGMTVPGQRARRMDERWRSCGRSSAPR